MSRYANDTVGTPEGLHFEKLCGSYYLMDRKNIVYMADIVGICFDQDTGALLKHGPAERVERYAEMLRVRSPMKIIRPQVLKSDQFELDDLNRLLTHSGYAKTMASKLMSEKDRPPS